MSVVAKYFVVRNGIEIDEVFEDKKQAEAYDKMLDASEKLSELIRDADLPVKLDDETIDKISVCLAKNAPKVTQILKGIKPIPTKPTEEKELKAPVKPSDAPAAKKKPGRKSKMGK